VRYLFESGPWYQLRFATSSPTIRTSEGGEIYLADVNLVVLAKLINGTKARPEGEIAKFSFRCDSSWAPVDSKMKNLRTLLGAALSADGEPFDWDWFRFREVLVQFAPPPRAGARNPLLDIRIASCLDTQEWGEMRTPGGGTPSVPRDPSLADPAALPAAEGKAETNLDGQTALPSAQSPVRTGRRDRKLLRGWPDICNALGIRSADNEKRSLGRLNKSQDGPIKHFGRGRLPEVFEEDLLTWWSDLEGRHQALQEKDASRRHSLDRPMHYGRRGEGVFPELSMHVQRLRQGPSGPADNDQN
jgi:hypothetical protein